MDLAGYNLYVRINNSLTYSLFDELTLDEVDPDNPKFLATDMERDVTYDFVVTAVSNAGVGSDFSSEVSVMNGEILNEEVISDVVSAGGDQVYPDRLTKKLRMAEEFSPPPVVFRDQFLLKS